MGDYARDRLGPCRLAHADAERDALPCDRKKASLGESVGVLRLGKSPKRVE